MEILVTAEAFGYGPIVTGIYIVENLKKKLEGKYVFMGSGIAMEQALRSKLFDEYITCDTFDMEQLVGKEKYFNRADFVLSVENLQGAVYAVQKNCIIYYIDNLFWMWKDIPNELNCVKIYFIVDLFNVDKNINRIGKNIKNIKKVGPLRKQDKLSVKVKKDQLIINLGGGESFLSNNKLICDYYAAVIKIVLKQTMYKELDSIVVCGGSGIINAIKNNVKADNVEYNSFSKDEYLDRLRESKYIILTPGLGNFFEALVIEDEVLMIPPINYSQYWQLEEYKKLNLGIETINWKDFDWYHPVGKYMDEDIGVEQVSKNIEDFLFNEKNYEKLGKIIFDYLNRDKRLYGNERRNYWKQYSTEGIKEIVHMIEEDVRSVSI